MREYSTPCPDGISIRVDGFDNVDQLLVASQIMGRLSAYKYKFHGASDVSLVMGINEAIMLLKCKPPCPII